MVLSETDNEWDTSRNDYIIVCYVDKILAYLNVFCSGLLKRSVHNYGHLMVLYTVKQRSYNIIEITPTMH